MTDRSAAHTQLVKDILLAFGARHDLTLWHVNTGAAVTKTGALVKFGVKGQADIAGIRAPTGRVLQIEVKTGMGTQSKEQRAWQAMIEKFGGAYLVARSVEDVRAFLDA